MKETKEIKAVILAAGMGSRISPLTDSCPKTLLTVGGRAILERMLSNIRAAGIRDVLIVLGYRDDQIQAHAKENFPDMNICFAHNRMYKKTNTAFSLLLAESFVADTTFIKFDADVVFDQEILTRLIACEHSNCLCVDKNINLAAEEIKVILGSGNRVLEANKSVNPAAAAGESIGIEKIDGDTAGHLFAELKDMMKDSRNHQKYYESAYENLIAKNVAFHALDITGLTWVEIDTKEDLATAEAAFG